MNYDGYFFKSVLFQIYRRVPDLVLICDSFDSNKQTKGLKSAAKFVGKMLIHFLINVVIEVAVVAS